MAKVTLGELHEMTRKMIASGMVPDKVEINFPDELLRDLRYASSLTAKDWEDMRIVVWEGTWEEFKERFGKELDREC